MTQFAARFLSFDRRHFLSAWKWSAVTSLRLPETGRRSSREGKGKAVTAIKDKLAVVTGGGSGIGAGLAKELAREGAIVAVADINLDNAERVAEEIVLSGGRAVGLHCNVCERESLHRLKRAVNDAFGPAQLVFANAGATAFTELAKMSDDDVDWIIQVNLMGVMNTTRAFWPDLIASGGGHIVATASMAGLLPGWIPNHVPYSAAKAGIIAMMMNLALEAREHGIFTTSYCPGGVASGMRSHNGSYRPDQFGGPKDRGEVAFDNSQAVAALSFWRPEDVAPIVLQAVRENRPFVFDHADQRPLFFETYSSVVEKCYDDIEAWEQAHGLPPANPTGAHLELSEGL